MPFPHVRGDRFSAEVTLQKLRCCIPREVDHRASISDGRILAVDVYTNIDGTVEGILDEIYQRNSLVGITLHSQDFVKARSPAWFLKAIIEVLGTPFKGGVGVRCKKDGELVKAHLFGSLLLLIFWLGEDEGLSSHSRMVCWRDRKLLGLFDSKDLLQVIQSPGAFRSISQEGELDERMRFVGKVCLLHVQILLLLSDDCFYDLVDVIVVPCGLEKRKSLVLVL